MGRIQTVGINITTATPISVVGQTQITTQDGALYVAYNDTEAQDGALRRRFIIPQTGSLPFSFDAGTGYTLWVLSSIAPTLDITVWTDIGQGSITGGY